MRVLSFIISGEYFAVDVNCVQTVARNLTVTPVIAAPAEISGVANVKGRVVTVVNLYKLLGYQEKRGGRQNAISSVNAIVFKSFSGNEDQMALIIGKRGELLDIEEDAVRSISATAGIEDEENFCISKIIESGNRIYRIVNIESILKKYTDKESNGGI